MVWSLSSEHPERQELTARCWTDRRRMCRGTLAGISVVSITVDELGGARPDAELVVIDQFESFFALDEGERTIGTRALAELAADAVVVIGLRADAFAEASLDPIIAPHWRLRSWWLH